MLHLHMVHFPPSGHQQPGMEGISSSGVGVSLVEALFSAPQPLDAEGFALRIKCDSCGKQQQRMYLTATTRAFESRIGTEGQ